MYPNLKMAIFKRGLRQSHLAKELGLNNALLSKIIHGFREPTAEQKASLARYLGEEEDWLFERFETIIQGRNAVGVYSTPGKEDGDS